MQKPHNFAVFSYANNMKKSNKTTVFYVFVSIALFLALAGGGVYGLYLSIGMNFMGSTGSFGGTNANYSSVGRTSNVSYQNTLADNMNGSSISIIILSVVLIVIAICDFVSMIKQVTFFKQYQFVKDSAVVKGIEKKTKSKTAVIVFAFIIDIFSIVASVFGLFFAFRYFAGNGFSWVFYLINGLIAILAIISIILLIVKIKQRNKLKQYVKSSKAKFGDDELLSEKPLSINKLEYDLLKLKHLKNCRVIQADEYEMLRKRILEQYESEKSETNYD